MRRENQEKKKKIGKSSWGNQKAKTVFNVRLEPKRKSLIDKKWEKEWRNKAMKKWKKISVEMEER